MRVQTSQQKEKCSMNKQCLTKDARTNLGAAHTWLSAAWGGQSDTWEDGGNQSWGGGCSLSCTSDQSGTGNVPSGSTPLPVEAWDGGASSTALACLPSISLQVVPRPSNTHRDALVPLEKLCLSFLDVKQVFNLHCFVPLFLRLAGTRQKALHPATFSAHQELEKARTGAQPCSSLFLPLEMQATHNDHILGMASPEHTRHGTVLLACRNCAKKHSNLLKRDVPNSPPAAITGNLWDLSQGCLIVL